LFITKEILIEEIGNKIIPWKRITDGSRDEKDNKYVECGIAADADYIISGNIHLLELEEYEGIKIVTAKNYLEIVNSANNKWHFSNYIIDIVDINRLS